MTPRVETNVVDHGDGLVTVRVAGEVDMTTARDLRIALQDAAPEDKPLVVDLNDVIYLDSSGVAVLFELARRRRLRVDVKADSVIAPVIRVVGLSQIADVRVLD